MSASPEEARAAIEAARVRGPQPDPARLEALAPPVTSLLSRLRRLPDVLARDATPPPEHLEP